MDNAIVWLSGGGPTQHSRIVWLACVTPNQDRTLRTWEV